MIPALAALIGAAGMAQLARLGAPWRYRALYEAAGRAGGVDANLLHALAIQESGENAAAIGPPNSDGSRDYGLMQINAANLVRLGLTTTTALDPKESVRAATLLIADNQRRAPNLGFLDQLSIYNAGFSKLALRPKLDSNGLYINRRYVLEVATWYAVVTAASFAPIKKLNAA